MVTRLVVSSGNWLHTPWLAVPLGLMTLSRMVGDEWR